MAKHKELFGYIRRRYSELFDEERQRTEQDLGINPIDEIVGHIDGINELNYSVCDGRISDIKELERMAVDEYYSTLITHRKHQKAKVKHSEVQQLHS